MLKRLQDEADQRLELEAKRKDLVNRRTATQADSKKRKNDLDNLTETLKKFIEVFRIVTIANLLECYSNIASISKVLIDYVAWTGGQETMIDIATLYHGESELRIMNVCMCKYDCSLDL